jgi:hypothetical protein
MAASRRSISAPRLRTFARDLREDPGHVALVEQMDSEAGAGEVLDDYCLEIGESKDRVGPTAPVVVHDWRLIVLDEAPGHLPFSSPAPRWSYDVYATAAG